MWRAIFYDHNTGKLAPLDAMIGWGLYRLLHDRNVNFDGTCREPVGAIVLATGDDLNQIHGVRTVNVVEAPLNH